MEEKVEAVLRSFVSTLQIAKLYTISHPKFIDSLGQLHLNLDAFIKETGELVIGIVGGELITSKEIFFELSGQVKPLINELQLRNIEKVRFVKGITKEELINFFSLLIKPPDTRELDLQKKMSAMGIKNIFVGKIKVSSQLSSAEVIESMSYLKQYEASLDKVSRSLGAILEEKEFDYSELKLVMADTMESLMGRYEELLKLGAVKKYDIITFVHLLNVSILSMYFSSRLGFIKDDILDIGAAALFHDIGKMYISQKIIKKSSRLTEEEFAKIANHTSLGAQILLKYADTLGELPILVAFEHHLHFDGKGYPKLHFSQRPHTASLIVSIADAYDALLQRRTYKWDYPPDLVYTIMMREKGTHFDPNLLDRFFKTMGVWPKNSIIALNDGRVAVVREINEDDIFSPKVEVIVPRAKEEIIDLRRHKEEVKIERFINPLGEGKKYLYLI